MLIAAGVLFAVAAVLGLPVTGMLGSSSKDFQDPSSQEERTDAAITAATGQSPYYDVVALLSGRREVRSDPAAQRAAIDDSRRCSPPSTGFNVRWTIR